MSKFSSSSQTCKLLTRIQCGSVFAMANNGTMMPTFDLSTDDKGLKSNFLQEYFFFLQESFSFLLQEFLAQIANKIDLSTDDKGPFWFDWKVFLGLRVNRWWGSVDALSFLRRLFLRRKNNYVFWTEIMTILIWFLSTLSTLGRFLLSSTDFTQILILHTVEDWFVQ